MNSARNAALALVAALAMALAFASSPTNASAGIYNFRTIIFEEGSFGVARSVGVDISGVDSGKTTNLRVRRPGMDAPVYVQDIAAGQSSINTNELTSLRPGDLIEVRQPLNAVDPVDTLVVPNGSLDISGSRVSGDAGTGRVRWLAALQTCLERGQRRLIPSAGRYSFDFGSEAAPGRLYGLNVHDGRSSLLYVKRAPGERPCVSVQSESDPEAVPGSKPRQEWAITLKDLDPTLPGTRFKVRRGDMTLIDHNLSTNGSGFLGIRERILPGDRIELYRPQSAATPSQVIEIPAVRATFDAAADLSSVKGADLRSAVFTACSLGACNLSYRGLLDVPARGGKVDFGKAEGLYPALDLESGDPVSVSVQFRSVPLLYSFDALAGDLVAPVQRIRAKSSYRTRSLLRNLKSGLPVSVASSEPASGVVRLVSGGLVLARASVKVRDEPGLVRLRFTSGGRKALRSGKVRTIRIESRLTDLAGNTSTSFRKLKLKS